MLTSQRNPTFLALITVFFVLIGFSGGGCGDSDDDAAPINEDKEPLVVMISGPRPINRSDASILADRILVRETDDFFFDPHQRDGLIDEIERVLLAIRAAYPAMAEIHAREDFVPDEVALRLEPDLYEIVTNLIKDKEGQVRFETGNLDFDALNAKLGLQGVWLGATFLRSVVLIFDERLNVKPASEAYSMLEGVRRATSNDSGGGGSDIATSKTGDTWYVVFRNAWGDCLAGCYYQELFFFTVMGNEVKQIEFAQAENMPQFRESISNRWGFNNDTPFVNAEAYTWSWGESEMTENRSLAFAGYHLGCSLFGEIQSTPNQIQFSCGYRIAEALPSQAKHRAGQTQIDDEPLDGFELTGIVLLVVATQERVLPGRDDSTDFVFAPLRVAKTADEIEKPEEVFFENVSMAIAPPSLEPSERWWGGVLPTFIVIWDNPQTARRAYQFLRPRFLNPASVAPRKVHPDCEPLDARPEKVLGLGVSWPLMDEHAEYMELAPDPAQWTDWIDEVLPRPFAPEAVD